MKRWIHSTENDVEEITSTEEVNQEGKLKRTPESGHSYEGTIVFENAEAMLKWCKEDELYED